VINDSLLARVNSALPDRSGLLQAQLHESLLDVLEDDWNVGVGDRLRDLAAHRAGAYNGGFEDEHGPLAWVVGGGLVPEDGAKASLMTGVR
jgi:hypothetical protein